MSTHLERLTTGAAARERGTAKASADVEKLKPPADPLEAIAYWGGIPDAISNRVMEAVRVARDDGLGWAEIAGALGTSTESARVRWHQYKTSAED